MYCDGVVDLVVFDLTVCVTAVADPAALLEVAGAGGSGVGEYTVLDAREAADMTCIGVA